MQSEQVGQTSPRWEIILCFVCVYLIWGSTYLAIKYAIVAMAPLWLSGFRFVLAGAILSAISRLRSEDRLDGADIRIAILSGCLLTTGNALVCVAEKWVPSGTVAVGIGSGPAWIMLFNWLAFARKRPTSRQLLGVVTAMVGIVFLARAQSASFGEGGRLASLALLASVISWSIGSLVQRKAGRLRTVFGFSAMQLLVGGAWVCLLALLSEGTIAISPAGIGWEAVLAFAYLVIFGSVIAYSAYFFLNRHVDATKVSTYAVVNPVIAVWLGWLFAGEPVSLSVIAYSALVLVGIYFVIFEGRSRRRTAIP